MDSPASPRVSGAAGHWTPYFVSSDAQETRAIVGRNLIAHRLEHRSAARRPVTVRFRTAALGRITLHEMAYSMFGDGEAAVNVPRMDNIYLLEMNLGGDMAVGQAKALTPFRPGEIYMINADAPHAKIWFTDGRQLMIKIHRRDMESALERLIGRPVSEPLVFDAVPRPVSGPSRTLRKLIELMCDDLELENSIFAGAEGANAEQMVLDLILRALPSNYSHQLANVAPRPRSAHVQRAVEYIHTHSEETIPLERLVQASGVSERALHAGFRRHFGVSPMTYLRNVRLDRARLTLRRLTPAETSVTAVALDCGFGHLGKFSAAYRERFGELPSETLRNV